MPMRTAVLPLIFFILLCFTTSGQTGLDSLLGVWEDETKADTARINALNLYARQAHMFSQPDSAFYLAGLGHQLAKSKGLRQQMAAMLNTQGFSRYVLGEYDEALKLYAESLRISEAAQDQKGTGAVLNNIGMVHMARGENEAALDHYSRSLTIQEALGNRHAMAVIMNNMGIIHMDMGDHERAIQGYSGCMKIAEELGNVKMILNALNNIGNVYQDQKDFPHALEYYNRSLSAAQENGDSLGCAQALNNMGIILRTLDEYDRAESSYNRSLNIYKSVGEKRGIATVLGNLGTIHRDKDNLELALELYSQSLALSEETGDKRNMSNALGNIAHIYRDRGDHVKAIDFDTRSLALAQEAEEPRGIREAAKSLFESYKVLGQFTKALEMHELYIAMRDSIMSEENQRETIRTEFIREAEQRDAEITLLDAQKLAEQQKQQATVAISIVLLVSAIGVFLLVMRNRRQRHQMALSRAELQKSLMELEKDRVENNYLRSRLNTHFMKNALSSINGLISSGQHTKAQEYIGRFHELMKWTLENASSDQVSLSEELEMMRHYLTLEAPCAEDGLSWEVHVADDIDATDVDLPPLILQPFVENALRHGLKGTGRMGEVRISVSRDGGNVVCAVVDNGHGMAPGDDAKPRSTGLRLVRERLDMFSRNTGMAAAMRMENTGSGTRAEVRLAA